MRHFGTLLERLYDLPLFLPLWIESRSRAEEEAAHAGQPAEET
jgi:hypothetical protein